MNKPFQFKNRFFFRIICSGQAYLNLLYLLAAFPLGVFYFVFLVTGLSTGISLIIIWVGIPILLLVGIAWWTLANFERFMVIHLLKEDLSPMTVSPDQDASIWTRFKGYFVNPVTWKSLLYLFLKFPLGLATFVVLITLISLTLAFLITPFTYQSLAFFQPGISIGGNQLIWQINSISDALLAGFIGLILWPVTLHISNGLTWVHAQLAKVMLSYNPSERYIAAVQ